MKIYVRNVPYMGMTTTLTDKELMIIVQAWMRGLVMAKIRVTYLGEERFLAVEAIDLARTLPLVVFEKPSLPPPPMEALLSWLSYSSAFLSPLSAHTSSFTGVNGVLFSTDNGQRKIII